MVRGGRYSFGKRVFALLALVVLLWSVGGCAGAGTARATGTELEVYCFAAGKADALLLTTENAAILIDCGEKGFGKTILAELQARGIDRIDYLIVTHFDQDHVGGAAKVIGGVSVGTVLQSDCPKDSSEYENYVEALAAAGYEPVTVRETYEFTLDGVRFSVDPPRQTDYAEDDSNNSSLIVTVYNGDNTLLFLGDAQTARLAEYLDADPAACDFVKIPHHGGEEELMDELLAAVRPAYAVITCSEEEPEADAVTAALGAAGVETYLTRVAAVKITSDGTDVTAAYVE